MCARSMCMNCFWELDKKQVNATLVSMVAMTFEVCQYLVSVSRLYIYQTKHLKGVASRRGKLYNLRCADFGSGEAVGNRGLY